MNKKRLMSMHRWQIIPTDNVSPYAIGNSHYVFRPIAEAVVETEPVDDSNMDLSQALAVINYIKGL